MISVDTEQISCFGMHFLLSGYVSRWCKKTRICSLICSCSVKKCMSSILWMHGGIGKNKNLWEYLIFYLLVYLFSSSIHLRPSKNFENVNHWNPHQMLLFQKKFSFHVTCIFLLNYCIKCINYLSLFNPSMHKFLKKISSLKYFRLSGHCSFLSWIIVVQNT